MDSAAIEQLRRGVSRFGTESLRDPYRAAALVKDMVTSKLERAALVAAAEEGVPLGLQDGGNATLLALRLQAERGLTLDVATWAIEAWQTALGLEVGRAPRDAKRGRRRITQGIWRRRDAAAYVAAGASIAFIVLALVPFASEPPGTGETFEEWAERWIPVGFYKSMFGILGSAAVLVAAPLVTGFQQHRGPMFAGVLMGLGVTLIGPVTVMLIQLIDYWSIFGGLGAWVLAPPAVLLLVGSAAVLVLVDGRGSAFPSSRSALPITLVGLAAALTAINLLSAFGNFGAEFTALVDGAVLSGLAIACVLAFAGRQAQAGGMLVGLTSIFALGLFVGVGEVFTSDRDVSRWLQLAVGPSLAPAALILAAAALLLGSAGDRTDMESSGSAP